MVSATGNHDIKNAIIVSNMYVNNFNRRVMAQTDAGYAALWNEAAQLQADLNAASLSVPKEGSEEETASGAAYQDYRVVSAKYDLALTEINREAAKRAINYLNSIESDDPQFKIGKALQLARLYFISGQMEEAGGDGEKLESLKKAIELIEEAIATGQKIVLVDKDTTQEERNALLTQSNVLIILDDKTYPSTAAPSPATPGTKEHIPK